MPLYPFPTDAAPVAADQLPSTTESLSWHNVQRKRLKKFAGQYIGEADAAVVTLRSQGETDTSLKAVQDTRAGFNELRVRLPVLSQYYTYSTQHGGIPETKFLNKIKSIILSWCTKNIPTGKPIDETNFENLIRVAKRHWASFSATEQGIITAWVQQLRVAKEAWTFAPAAGEGSLLYGNHYTHHYKILYQVYDFLGDTAKLAALRTTLQTFVNQNFPFGNAAVSVPPSHPVVGASVAEKRFDIDGNFLAMFSVGSTIYVAGNTRGHNGYFRVTSVTYLTSSNKTRLFFAEPLSGLDGGGGSLYRPHNPALYDMPRPAVDAGETIDYIRRNAMHYHQYDLEPWIELVTLSNWREFDTKLIAGLAFLRATVTAPNVVRKPYEFTYSSDTFDALRWQTSHSEYLQPSSMYVPDKMARLIFACDHYFRKNGEAATQTIDTRLYHFAMRSRFLPSTWPYYFRFVFGGVYG